MNISHQRIEELARKWMSGTITPDEINEFMEWYNHADDGQPLNLPAEFATDEVSHGMRMFKNIYEANRLSDEKPPVHRVHFLKTAWFRYAAAALLLLGIGTYVFTINRGPVKPEVAVTAAPANDVKAPESVNAIVTLADGRKIVLDSAANGAIATQDNVVLKKLDDGRIVYEGSTDETAFNTLTNPRGSRVIQMTLADGTKLWLNTASSIRYPTFFNGKERLVEVTGESYFEVAKDASKPFRVRKNDLEIEVLGTHFNVNAYDEEERIEVTLLEGAVQVKAGNALKVRLLPGEQSQLTRSSNLTKTAGVDVEAVMAWKNGRFDFGTKSDVHSIMRQLSRWYDVEAEIRGTFPTHFGGSISRQVNLSQVLKVLETTDNVHFEVVGKKVIVTP